MQTHTQSDPILYRVTPHDLAGHRLQVDLTISHPDPDGQVLSLPAWIPGSYLMRDFSRHIDTIQARSSDGLLVTVSKTGTHAWRCSPVTGALTIRYTVYAWDLSVRSAHVDDTHAFFNGTSVYLQVHGQEHRPCRVTLVAPPARPRWRVFTSLPAAPDEHGARRHSYGDYLAPDYDALLDHPVEMGTPQVITFQAGGARHEIVFTGRAPQLDLPRIAADVQCICDAQIGFFEPDTRQVPFRDSSPRYVFLVMVTEDGYGGLEHRASTALLTRRDALPTLGRTAAPAAYEDFLGLVSHEYFHTWHVKRIKPAVFAPYDLSRPVHTRLLWVFEGFTSYYDDLLMLRAGVITQSDYLKRLARTITQVQQGAGRLKQSIADSSFDAWTRFYQQDENAPNAIVSYYTKGSLAALALDLRIRSESQGRRSLDDVMRLMWQRYGRQHYRGQRDGLPEDAMHGLILEATGVDVAEDLARYVDGCGDAPLDDLVRTQGWQLQRQPIDDLPSLQARLREANGQVQFAVVHADGAAHQAGLSAHDTVVAIDHLRVNTLAAVQRVLRAHQPGDVITLHVFRRDELREVQLTLAASDTRYAIVPLADAASPA